MGFHFVYCECHWLTMEFLWAYCSTEEDRNSKQMQKERVGSQRDIKQLPEEKDACVPVLVNRGPCGDTQSNRNRTI